MPSFLLSQPLEADEAQRMGIDMRHYDIGETVVVDDFVAQTLLRVGYGIMVGPQSNVLVTNVGPPTADVGVDGQWYYDSYNEALYGPKVGGLWPATPYRPDRGVAHFVIDGNGHLQMTYSTGTTVDLGYIIGAAAELAMGSVTTGAAGSQAAATLTPTAPGEQRLDLTIPQGAKGDQGVQGVQGVKGDTGPQGPAGATPPNATTTVAGTVKIGGDVGGTWDSLTVPGLANKVNTSVVGQPSGVASLDPSGKVPASQIPAGATGSDQGSVTVDTTTTPGSAIVTIAGNWGLTDTGQVYYDPAGAVAAEAAMLVPDPDGNGFSLFRPGGPWTSEDQRVATFVLDTTSRLYAALAPMIATGQRLGGNPQAGTTYTLTAADVGSIVYSTGAAAATFTVPTHAAVPIPTGAVIEVMQAGAGQLALAAAAGVTIVSPNGSLALRAQYARARLIYQGNDLWALDGHLTDFVADQATRPIIKVRRAAAQSVTSGGFAAIAWDTLDVDTAGGSYTSGATTVKIPRSGYYWIQAGVDMLASVVGRRAVQTWANRAGTDINLHVGWLAATGANGGDSGIEASGVAYLQAGDLVRSEFFQDTGATQTTSCPDFCPTVLSLMWMRY